MGSDCSTERENFENRGLEYKSNMQGGISGNIINDNILPNFVDIKNYKEYNYKIETMRRKINDKLDKFKKSRKLIDLNLINNSDLIKEGIESSYYNNLKEVRVGKLFEIAYLIYNKIGTIYGNSMSLPKQELAKVNYNLISRYLAYEDVEEEDEDIDPKNIIQKIIKRINFLSDEFPYKLKRIEYIVRSKKIYVFGHDIYNRITFYIRPYYKGKEQCIKNVKGFYDDKNELYSYTLENIDYVIFMFFVLECFLPSIREKLNFSDQINIVLDFNYLDADSEFIRFLLYHMNNYYPLVIGKMHIINYELYNLKKNLPFRMDLINIDKFRNTIFQNETFKFQIIREYYPNLLPIEYGGYHNTEGYKLSQNLDLDEFIDYILSMIILKRC